MLWLQSGRSVLNTSECPSGESCKSEISTESKNSSSVSLGLPAAGEKVAMRSHIARRRFLFSMVEQRYIATGRGLQTPEISPADDNLFRVATRGADRKQALNSVC